MRVILIHNPTAGNGSHTEGEALEAMIRRAGHKVKCWSAKDNDWKSALKEGADLVAVAGGDGTVGKVARRLAERGVPIAVLPTGTANNIATTLGLTEVSHEQLVAGWATAPRIGFDVGTVRGPMQATCFVEGLGVGFLPAMLRLLANLGDESGDPIAAARREFHGRLRHYPARHLHVTLDDQDFSGEYVLVEAMNIRYIGPKLHVAPHADPGDGLLDVVLLRDGEQDELSSYILHSHEKTWIAPDLPVKRGGNLRITGEQVEMHLDDKTWPDPRAKPSGKPTTVEVKVDRHALTFLGGPEHSS